MRADEAGLEERLVQMVLASPGLMAALKAVRSLGLSSWCIGAGAVRNLVWDELHGFTTPSVLPDLDVAHFDPLDLSARRDDALRLHLQGLHPGVPWEITNQAAVHLWYEGHFGMPVPPLRSLREAIASWPEVATAVGVTLREDDAVEVIAPLGLADLFGLVVRHNPVRASAGMYRERVARKRFAERWPRVRVEAA
jgi:uncharacterized protein